MSLTALKKVRGQTLLTIALFMAVPIGGLLAEIVGGGTEPGHVPSSYPVLVGGTDSSGNVHNFRTDTSGRLTLDPASVGSGGGTGGVVFGIDGTTAATAANPFPIIAEPSSSVIGHVISDSGSTTTVTGNVTVVQPTGTNLHVVNDTSTNTIGNVVPVSSTTGGVQTYSFQGGTGNAALTNTAVSVATGAHSLHGVEFVNLGTSAAYVQVFDVVAGSVTVGTTVPKMFFWLPAGGAWDARYPDGGRIAFTNAITFCATTTVNGSVAPATSIIGNVEYL